MKFVEVTVSTASDAQELVADIMWSYTNYGVAISDALDVKELVENRRDTWDYIDEKVLEEMNADVTLVKAYIALDVADETIAKIENDLAGLKKRSEGFIGTGSLELVKRTVDGDDWIEIWRKHYKPMKFGNIVVCPAWIKYGEKPGETKILIDSNMAFGTGEHETTSMVLEIMQEYIGGAKTVIDVGTGSGILGIAAAKLGAKKVFMTDIDYVAVKTASHNAEMNGVKEKCEVCLNDLLKEKQVKGELVLANITADVLLILSRDIVNHVDKNGVMIMSGIIKGRVDEVVERYTSLGFTLEKRKEKGEWIAIAMRKV